jgi:hypothetical protein
MVSLVMMPFRATRRARITISGVEKICYGEGFLGGESFRKLKCTSILKAFDFFHFIVPGFYCRFDTVSGIK